MAISDALERVVERLSGWDALDKAAAPVASGVGKVIRHGTLKDVLSGTWLGHPLHPMLTDVPIGAWTCAFVLDLIGDERTERASELLVGLGTLSALPTAAAGLSDWSDTWGDDRRLGMAHAAGNVAAVAAYGLSYMARRGGNHRRGVGLAFVGATVATAGAYLGGHLGWRRGVNVNRNAWTHGADDWVVVAAEGGLAEGLPVVARAGDEDVLLVRHAGEIFAVANVCGHAGGPLNEGKFDDEGCVTCPWHQSTFRLRDGTLVHGPATAGQPAYEVRVDDAKVSVRRRRD